jgi:imidazolonepropionase-like amidohydrolase
MSRRAILLFVLLPGLAAAEPEPQPKVLAFTHVNVIDGSGGPCQPDRTVVVTGDRITSVGKAGEVAIPEGARVVEAKGQYLIPGLWDMHVHWYDKDSLSLFTANGVTGVREMFGEPIQVRWRKDQNDGTLLGPRLVLAGPIVDGPKPIWPGSIAVANEEDGRKAVQTIKKQGYDFVKVYNLLSRESYLAIADESKKQGIPFAGHIPFSVSAAEASDRGQKSMEHLYRILRGCSSKEVELAKLEAQAWKNPLDPDRPLLRRLYDELVETYDEKKAAALFAKFKANGTWQVPTLTVLRAMAYLDDATFTADKRVKYLPRALRDSWNPKNDFRLKKLTKEDYAQNKKQFRRNLELVGAMHRAGVEILAGTDTLNPYCFPGFSLHDELELLVKAGLSPQEALQTATRGPARYLGGLKDLGTIEAGKIADLVLLDADPLADIGNTRKIAAVVVGGKLQTKEVLQKMLADVEAAANKKKED